jgi:hypothetical protein
VKPATGFATTPTGHVASRQAYEEKPTLHWCNTATSPTYASTAPVWSSGLPIATWSLDIPIVSPLWWDRRASLVPSVPEACGLLSSLR